MWRHAETGAVVDLASFWVAGQPNGVRVQNCAGIWELVSSAASQGRSSSYTARCGQDGAGSTRYDDGGCDTEAQCSLCSFSARPSATLRGLCGDTEAADVFYTLMRDEDTGLPYYQGDTGTSLRYSEAAGEWEMARGGAVVARAAASLQALGTGALSWSLDTALCGAEAGASFSTIMTVCTVRGQLSVITSVLLTDALLQRDEFTCHGDGSCVPMVARCDQFPHCADFSDEADCGLVVRPGQQ